VWLLKLCQGVANGTKSKFLYLVPRSIGRMVYFFSEHKRTFALGVIALLWLVVGPVLALASITAFVVYQYSRFHAAVQRHRMRRILVVHTGSADAASRARKQSCDSIMSLEELEAHPESFFHLVDGSVALHLVADDHDVHRAAKFLDWLTAEATTRIRESRMSGWRFNIVYTDEGRRRMAFMRLTFSVESVSDTRELAEHIGTFLATFSALQVDDAVGFGKAAQLEPGDVLGLSSFYSWLFGCSCCVQRSVESSRNHPSVFRVNFVDMLYAAWISREATWQVYRSLRDTVIGFIPFKFLSRNIPFPLSHGRPVQCPGDCIFFVSTWGDESLLDPEERDGVISSLDYVVSDHFRIVDKLGHEMQERWLWEHAFFFPGKHVIVTHPRSRGEFAFQIGDAETLNFLETLRPGTAADPDSQHKPWLVASGLWVRIDKTDTLDSEDGIQNDLRGKGYTVIAPHRLIPRPYWNAVRCFHRSLRPWLYKHSGQGKFRTWNDEPVARQIQVALTNWVSRVACPQEKLVQSALALSIFIQRGPGFIYHTDSSPPFDLTFDIVADHQGVEARPVFFVRRSDSGALLVERLELKYGEAVLFSGAQLTHFGGDLNNLDVFHSVQLYTWQYVRD
jgi:hypothetical protein